MKAISLAVLFAVLSIPVTHAAVIVSGDLLSNSLSNCSITFTSDISYTLKGGSPFGFQLIFKNWVTASNGLPFLANLAGPVKFEIDGVAMSVASPYLQPNQGMTTVDLSPRDGSVIFQFPEGTTEGEVITIKAGTYSFQGYTGLNPQMFQTFTGDTVLADFNGGAISQHVAVPEASLTMLFGFAGVALMHRRRRA